MQTAEYTWNTYCAIFFSQHGFFRAKLKTHQCKFFISQQGKHEVQCAKIVLALSAIIIVTYVVTIICLPRKSHHKLLSTDESKVTFYVDAMSWSDITPSLCLHIQKLELTIYKNKLPK